MSRSRTGNDFVDSVKRHVIIGIASDDILMNLLVLKGGNALELVYQITSRASFDLDFSIEGSIPDLAIFSDRLKRALEQSFAEIDLAVIDYSIVQRPPEITEDLKEFWGGYLVEFKLVDRAVFLKFQDQPEQLRKNAKPIGVAGAKSKYKIDISQHEYCVNRIKRQIDDYDIYVYSPAMIVAEKLRAICQQMPEYGAIVKRSHTRSGRSRDFFDIFTVTQAFPIEANSQDFQELLKAMFSIKHVPLRLLGMIDHFFDQYKNDFQQVRETVDDRSTLQPFEFYFEAVKKLIESLKAHGDI